MKRLGRLGRTRPWCDDDEGGGWGLKQELMVAVVAGATPVLVRLALERAFPKWFEEPEPAEEE